MAQKDIVSKQLIQRIAVDLAVYLLKLDIRSDELELIATEQQRVEDRRADVVAKVKQSQAEFILHIEIQNNNDGVMPLRMLRYYTDICFANPHQPVRQYLIYIGRDKLTMPCTLSDEGLAYRYTIIDMHSIDYQDLLNQNTPDAIVLAILGDFKHDSKREAVQEIVLKLHQQLASQPQRFREYLSMLEILSENRNLKMHIKEVEKMITQFNIENFPSYELGMERGLEKGLEQGLEQGLERVIKQLLRTQSPEQVATLIAIPLDKIKDIQNKTEH